jgi:hypothetical protein
MASTRSVTKVEGAVQFVRPTDHYDWLNFSTRRATGQTNLVEHGLSEDGVCRVAKHAHALHRRQHVPKQVDAFSVRGGRHQGDTGYVTAGIRKARDDAGFDWFARQYYGWNIQGRLLRCQGARNIERHDDIDLESDQFGREIGKPIQFAFRRTKLEDNVASLNIALFTHPLPKFALEGFLVGDPDIERSDAGDLRLLRPRHDRPCCRSAD